MTRLRSTAAGRLMLLVTALGLLLPLAAAAQEASPAASPEGLGQGFHSKTREEIQAELKTAFAETDEPAQNTDGTLILGETSDLQSLNPFLAESFPSIPVVQLIFEGLFVSDPRTGEPVAGALTDSYDIAPDGVTYTFHLSKTAKWSDGVDFTAADVDFSLQALADPATASTYTSSFNDTVASWQVIDDDTIQIVAKEPRYTVIYDLQGLLVVAKHIWENVPHDQWKTDPGSTGEDPSRVVGTGRFKFDSWQQGQEIRLVRNDDYHDQGAMPKVKEYVIRVFPDGEAQFNAFLNGEIDYIERLDPEQVETVRNTPGLTAKDYPDRGFTYYEFNLNQDVTTLFQDARVRQAFMYALDREAIVRDIRLTYGEVAAGTQPEISPGYAPDQITTKYTYDPDKAKQLLAEAGWTDTNGNGTVDKDGQEMSFELLYRSGAAYLDSLAAYLQDAWKAVGIDAHPKSLEFSALIEATTSNLDWRMAIYGFSWDATFIQDAMFGTNQYQSGFNDMKYSNPQLDEIFAQTKREFDPEKRRQLLIQASNIVNDDQPVGVMYFDRTIDAWNNRVHNANPGAWTDPLTGLSSVGTWVEA
jgi:peptide/nickel transport system substrate-binding protein